MPTDKTNKIALKQIQDKYGDQIERFEYKVYKKPYLAKEPNGAFCAGMTRYRKYYKVTHVILKNGTRIPIGGVGCLVSIIVVILIPIGFLCL